MVAGQQRRNGQADIARAVYGDAMRRLFLRHYRRIIRKHVFHVEPERIGQAVTAYVQPTLVPKESPEGAVHANFNYICYDAEYAGRQSFYGQGAGRYPTAYNVVEDLLDLNRGEAPFYADRADPVSVSNELISYRYYVRTTKPDAWLSEIIDERWDGAVITKPVPVRQMHAWARELGDEGLFFAAIR